MSWRRRCEEDNLKCTDFQEDDMPSMLVKGANIKYEEFRFAQEVSE